MKVSPTYAAVHHRSNAKSRSKPLTASLHPNPQLSPSSSINGLADQISTQQLQSELQAEKAPRPPNAFILYRRAKQPEVIRQQGHTSNAKLSQLLGEMWKNETEEIKYHWKRAADRKKMEHSQKYPGYVYRPKKPAHVPKKRNLKRNNEKKSVPTNFEVMVMNSNHTESTPETSNTSCQSSYPNVNNEDFNNFLKKSWLTHTNNEGQGFCNSHDTQYLDQLHPFFDESVTGQLQNAQQINDPFTAAAPYPLIYDYQQQGDLLDVQSSSEFSLPNFDTIPFPTDSIIQANLL